MNKRNLALLLCVSFCLLACGVAFADNWPRFRGPNGTGVAADKDIPVKFDEKSGILWKVPIPGAGNSSPIVWKDRLFLQSGTKQDRTLYCLSTKDGQVLWSRAVPGGQAKFHGLNSPASSSPATDGEMVVAIFWDGDSQLLKAYDIQGKPKWERKLGAFKSEHGHGASPVIYDGKVYFANDQDGSSVLQAFDVKTGSTIWEAKRPYFRACYTAPFVMEKGGKTELICVNTMEATSYDPATGSLNWKWDWEWNGQKPLRTIGTPVVSNGMMFAFSGDGGGPREMIGLNLDGNKTSLAWKKSSKKPDLPYVPCPLIHGDHLYFVHDKGEAGCFEAKTGKKIWQQQLPGVEKVNSSPVLIDGKIYAGTDEGDVFVIRAAPKFEVLARNRLDETIRATPAVADNRLYIRGDTHLFCIGKKG